GRRLRVGLLLGGAGPDRGQGQRVVRRAGGRAARRSGSDRDGPGRAGHPDLRQLRFPDADPGRRHAQPGPRPGRGPDGSGRGHCAAGRLRKPPAPPADRGASGKEAVVKVSADRVLYLSRVILRKLKDNMNLVQKADDETARRAIQRALAESYKELDEIEQKADAAFAKRKNVSPRDLEYLQNQRLEDELRKHGA